MASTATWKQHDLEPPVQSTLRNADGTGIDLSTATAVYFLMRPVSGGTPIRQAATVVSASAGTVKYVWQSTNTDTVGSFYQEWEIMWPSTRPQTVPNDTFNLIVIVDDLDN
jgi:hypothetical protein